MTEDERAEIAYQAYLDNRVRLRCTNTHCEYASGFWVRGEHKHVYTKVVPCCICGSKCAETLREING